MHKCMSLTAQYKYITLCVHIHVMYLMNVVLGCANATPCIAPKRDTAGAIMVSPIPASLELFTLPLLLSSSYLIAISISWAIGAGNESRWQELVAPYPGSERKPYRQVLAIVGKHTYAPFHTNIGINPQIILDFSIMAIQLSLKMASPLTKLLSPESGKPNGCEAPAEARRGRGSRNRTDSL